MDTPQIPLPQHMTIAITGRCNLRCNYCFYADEMVALSDLTTEDWQAAFQKLGNAGIFRVTLTGGEVFTRPDLFELLDSVIANRMRYSLLTNGTLITEKVLQKFEEGKRFLRLDSVQVSIDGSQAEIHNKSRPNSFDRALRGLRLLVAAHFPVVVRVTITRYNVDDLENIARLLLEDVGLDSFTTNETMPIGAGCQLGDQLALSSLEQLQSIKTFEKLNGRYPGRLRAMAGPYAKLTQYAEMERARETGVLPTSHQVGCLSACNAAFSQLDILHDGTIVPCHLLPDMKLGNITTDDLQSLWDNHPALKALRVRHKIPMAQVPGCKGCEWTAYCNGGCPGLAYELTGDYNRANPQDCYRNFLAETGLQHANHR